MGNKVTNSSISSSVSGEFEHRSGKLLLAAIRLNDATAVQRAIDKAKSEFSKPVGTHTNKADYEEMISNMKKYLTNQYDIGDGPLFTRAPSDYAAFLKAANAKEAIDRNLLELDGLIPGGSKFNESVGEVTHDRAALAKARLQAFRQNKT